jgi:predicted acetyltransferase
MDTKWSGIYELLIIKCGADDVGFCVVAHNGYPEVAKFFICPKFRITGLSVTAAQQVFSHIESQHGAIYSLQVLEQGPFVDRAWRFWAKVVAKRTAVQSGSNILIGNWE